MPSQLFAKKPLASLLSETTGENQLKRTLGRISLIALGIGAIIGAGLFVRTAAASAEHAGAAVTLSFVVAGVGCALAGLCYAEFASMIPIAGSAYTYSYTTIGEFFAWIIGWDLILEYGVGAATVAIAWSEYLNKVLEALFDVTIPYALCHSPFQSFTAPGGEVLHGIINLPALGIIALLSLLLIRGTQESAFVNALIVILKVAIVLLFIVIGWQFIDGANYLNYIPTPELTNVAGEGQPERIKHFGGLLGILGGAGVVFFAFIGFDAVSTAAQEAKNPKKDMAWGILGSLAICTVLYILFAYVLTGVAHYTEFRSAGKEASVAYAIQSHMPGFNWLATAVSIAILAGFSSVILVMLLGQSRVFFSMSRDGLVPPVFSTIHKKFKTPYKSNLIFLVFVGLFASFVPGDIVGDMTSIGTLFAFILVSVGIWVLRRQNPDAERPFKTPLVPLVPILSILVCLAMVFGLGWTNWLRLGIWLAIGLLIYFLYSRYKSKLRKSSGTPPTP